MDWMQRLQEKEPGLEVLSPHDPSTRHPYPGAWVVTGPTGEFAFSHDSAEDAAIAYLSSFFKDEEASAEWRHRNTKRRHP